MKLCETLPKHKGDGIYSVATIRSNRLRGCPVMPSNELKRKGRGATDFCCTRDNKLCVVKWFDNREVILTSTYKCVDPVEPVRRWDKRQRQFIDVPCPQIVKEYNQFMGGVDLTGMLISLYRIDHKCRKWHRRVFFWAIHVALTNSWLKYRVCHRTLPSSLHEIGGNVPHSGSGRYPSVTTAVVVRKRFTKGSTDVVQRMYNNAETFHSPWSCISRSGRQQGGTFAKYAPLHQQHKLRINPLLPDCISEGYLSDISAVTEIATDHQAEEQAKAMGMTSYHHHHQQQQQQQRLITLSRDPATVSTLCCDTSPQDCGNQQQQQQQQQEHVL
ncbi:PiggyBac transposable element-derived protein [Trichinella pseudospiralis]